MLNLTQWPAMAVTIIAAWVVASSDEKRRRTGFWTMLASNALWIIWGISSTAWALVALQVALASMNIRGAVKAKD